MKKPFIITIGNSKGGVGKTTTAVNLAYGIALAGKRVLLIDGDPQANSTSCLTPDLTMRETYSLLNALKSAVGSFSGNAVPTRLDTLDIVPTTIKCMEWEVLSYHTGDNVLAFSRLIENDDHIADYDFVIIDTPPNIGPMLRNALLISDSVIVPCPVGDQFAIDGFSVFLNVLLQSQQKNKTLRLMGVLLTKIDGRAPSHRKNKDRIRAYFNQKGIPVFDSVIRVNIDLDRAHSFRKSIFEFDPGKSGAEDYHALSAEVIIRAEEDERDD